AETHTTALGSRLPTTLPLSPAHTPAPRTLGRRGGYIRAGPVRIGPTNAHRCLDYAVELVGCLVRFCTVQGLCQPSVFRLQPAREPAWKTRVDSPLNVFGFLILHPENGAKSALDPSPHVTLPILHTPFA